MDMYLLNIDVGCPPYDVNVCLSHWLLNRAVSASGQAK